MAFDAFSHDIEQGVDVLCVTDVKVQLSVVKSSMESDDNLLVRPVSLLPIVVAIIDFVLYLYRQIISHVNQRCHMCQVFIYVVQVDIAVV